MSNKTTQVQTDISDINFQALFESAPGLYLVLRPDSKFTIIAVNQAYLNATKTKRKSIIGKGLFEVFPDNPDDPTATGTSNLRASLEHVVKQKKPNTMAVQKYDIQLPEGGFEEKYWSPLNTPVFNKKGKIEYIIHRVEDVTEFIKLKQKGQKQSKLTARLRDHADEMEAEIYSRAQEIQAINKELRSVNEQLSKLDEMKTQFFTNVSHEFRTPLTLMLGPIESILQDKQQKLAPKLRKDIELAHGNALRLERLVNNLLDFSRLEAGKNSAVYQPIDLSQLTYELTHHFESVTRNAGVYLNVDCESLGQVVYVDRGFWEKIVLNLLSNAIKHTFEGSIELRLRRDDNMAKLTVTDSGTGIPKKALPHIFERFYQVKGTKSRTNEGSGIGLALVNDLVKLHGGTISVDSTEGKGTTFTVRIPFGKAHLPKDQIAKSVRTEGMSDHLQKAFMYEAGHWAMDDYKAMLSSSGSTATVMVVDDNSDMRYYIKSVLNKNKNWSVILAPDGLTALQIVDEIRPDIILSDIMMPQMDGHELVKKLKQKTSTKTIPIIFLSARAGEEAKLDGLASGVDDYLVKPFTANELMARVNAHLKLAHERRMVHDDELRALRDLNVAKINFIEKVSKLIRGPSSSVKKYTQDLLTDHDSNLTNEQHSILKKVYENNEQGRKLVDNLISESKDNGMILKTLK